MAPTHAQANSRMTDIAHRGTLSEITPNFIVRSLLPSIAFYRDQLGFDVAFTAPAEEPFFAIVRRDAIQIMLKAIAPDVVPTPNSTRHPWARCDAYIHTPDPDTLAHEFTARGVILRTPLGVTDDTLRGFELVDHDGYVLYFGRPA